MYSKIAVPSLSNLTDRLKVKYLLTCENIARDVGQFVKDAFDKRPIKQFCAYTENFFVLMLCLSCIMFMFYYYLYCILLCFIVYYPTPFPQAFGTLAPMPQCQLMLPVPEVPLAGVWGSLPLSSRMYLCIMYALLQQSYVSMFLCMYLCRYQCDRSKGCVFIDFQGVVLPFSFWSPPGYNYYYYFFSSYCL